MRDLGAQPPQYSGKGQPPKAPFQRVDKWRDALPEDAWTRLKVRDGEKGPLEIEITACPVQTKIGQRNMTYDETPVITRCLDEEGATKHDFYLSDAPSATPHKEFARVAIAAHRVEEAIKRSKSQQGFRTTRFAIGPAGITIRYFHSLPHGSWCGSRIAEKNGPRQSRSHKFEMGLPCSPEQPTNATGRPKSPRTKHVD